LVKFGIEFVPDTHPQKIVKYSTLAEQGGFDYIWVTDHYCNRNPYIVLTAIAFATQKISLGTGVTNPYVVNPAWTASAVASLDEVSGGRAVLGLGAGDKVTLASLGIAFLKPLSAIKESTEVIRKLWRGEVVKYEGKVVKLNGANLRYKPTREIPVYIGAQGPRMLKLAGKIGDGVLINASHPRDFEFAIKQIKIGAEEAKRDLATIDVTAYTSFSVDYDTEKAKTKAAPIVAFIVAGCPPEVLGKHDIPVEDASKIGKALGDGKFGDAFGAVTDQMVDAFSIYGTPKDCINKIRGLVKIGVTQIVVGSPIGPKKKNSIGIIAKEIIPEFK